MFTSCLILFGDHFNVFDSLSVEPTHFDFYYFLEQTFVVHGVFMDAFGIH